MIGSGKMMGWTAIWLLATGYGSAAELRVTSPKELKKAVAKLVPGDSVILASGEWRDLKVRIVGKGTESAPITLRAEEPGRTIITGESIITLAGEYLVVADLHFKGVDPPGNGNGIVVFDGSAEIPATHSRLTNCFFDRCNPADPETRYPWVSLGGAQNRVDHCRFEGMNHSGVTVQVRVPTANPAHRIDHNLFLDRPPGGGNGFECIQLGQSQDSRNDGGCVVESNWFEQCDGETEIVSVKTCRNVVRGNMFLRSDGTVTLRHGTDSLVEGNWFIGAGKKGAGGVRIIDEGHRVIGNYFNGLDAVTGGIVVFYCGIPGSPLNGYFPANRTTVEGNRFVNCAGPTFELRGGFMERDRTIVPSDITIRRNVIAEPRENAAIFGKEDVEKLVLEGNVYTVGAPLGREDSTGFRSEVIVLVEDGGLRMPVADPALKPLPKTLTRKDVGPTWLE